MIGQRIQKYRIIRQIGQGGMGAVYEAVHEGIGQRVAVKVLRPAYLGRPDLVDRFFNEARAVHIVDHAGLVKTFDFGQLPDGTPYLTMEFLEGESLQVRLGKSPGGLALAEALRIARQVASALAATHRVGIVHRDLKPDNIFLLSDPEAAGGERVKLLDFGIAKFRIEAVAGPAGQLSATASGALLGTPQYMSPEQCRGAGGVGDRSDIYALGLVLYEMLSGQPPFQAQAAGDLIMMHMIQAAPPLQLVAPRVPAEVAALVHRMLDKAPGSRPPASSVVEDLVRLGAGPAQDRPGAGAGPLPEERPAAAEGRTPKGAPSTLGTATGTSVPRSPADRSRAAILAGALLLCGMVAGSWALRPARPPRRAPDVLLVPAHASQAPPAPAPVAAARPAEPGGAPPPRATVATTGKRITPARKRSRHARGTSPAPSAPAVARPAEAAPVPTGPDDEDYVPEAVH